jgi:hypothetical protein
MKWIFVALAFAAALYALHRLFLWMEFKGWIYYKNRKASPGTRASAALEIQSLLEPEKRHVLKIQQEQHVEQDDAGDPP